MNNVSLVTVGEKRIWLGKLSGEEKYGALVKWAQDIATNGTDAEIPEILIEHQFLPLSTN